MKDFKIGDLVQYKDDRGSEGLAFIERIEESILENDDQIIIKWLKVAGLPSDPVHWRTCFNPSDFGQFPNQTSYPYSLKVISNG